MALLPQYSPYFKYRGQHDIYDLGGATQDYDWSKGSGSADYQGHFIYNPQSTGGSTGKIIKGDFCMHCLSGGRVGGYSQQAAMDIKVKLWCHDRRLGTNPNNPNEWVDRTSCLQITPNNTRIKISTLWNHGAFINHVPIYGLSVWHNTGKKDKDGNYIYEHVIYDTSSLKGMSAGDIDSKLNGEGYTGNRGFDGDPYFLPEPVAYRYHSNNGKWGPKSDHIKALYTSITNVKYLSYDRSNGNSKSTLDGGGGDELEYKFIFNNSNGVGLDYFRLQFTVKKMNWYFPQKPIFANYNKIDNPMLSVPDFCNRNDIINWPDRYDAMSYYYDGSWKKYIPLFKFYDGSSWTCF